MPIDSNKLGSKSIDCEKIKPTERKNYSKMLLKAFPKDKSVKITEIPLMINTIDAGYPFAFIDYEESDLLGVSYTVEDGTEHFVVINKEHIVDVQILYEQDVNIFFEEPEENHNDMYQ